MANPTLVGFGRACASLRAPVFLSSLIHKTGRCAPPAHRSFAASYSSPNYFKYLNNVWDSPFNKYLIQKFSAEMYLDEAGEAKNMKHP